VACFHLLLIIARMSTKTFPNGVVITTYPVPPASFDFGKVAEEDRALYGLPRFTAGSGVLEQLWQAKVRNLGFVEPEFKPRDRRRSKLPGLKLGHGTETSNIWSGCVAFPASGDKIWDVNGIWNIPKATLPPGAQNGIWYTASSWIGIDGDDGSGDVLQAGCDADVMISGGNTQYQFNPWWEWYPADSFWITNMLTSAGDEYFCWIQCLSLLFGAATPNSALIILANNTKGIAMPFGATAPANVSLKGNCAEWIVEALGTGPNNTPELAQYTPVYFNQCAAVTVNDKVVLPNNGNTINMVSSTNNVISQGSFLGSVTVSHT
jgi:hypothetical protein